MTQNKLHIVAFDVPFPPNYGGVIDVFYKIKTLHKLGVEIYLHVFEYGRGTPQELEQFCEKVFYYPRNTSFIKFLSIIPFVVKTRASEVLIKNIKEVKADILFEGLHSTFPLIKNQFKERKTLVRTHNIEHFYYKGLAKSESNYFKKIFYWIESLKLKKYESILNKVDYILTISPYEHNYFKSLFKEKTVYIPVFHQNKYVKIFNENGNKIIYHGDLRISDNIKVVNYLIDIFIDFPHDLIIASSFENKALLDRISRYTNIKFIKISSSQKMDELFNAAHINIILTFQKTGIKLKLINSLYQGRFIIANSEMIEDTGLENLCELANTKDEIRNKIISILKTDYNENIVKKRVSTLLDFNTEMSAKKIIELLS